MLEKPFFDITALTVMGESAKGLTVYEDPLIQIGVGAKRTNMKINNMKD